MSQVFVMGNMFIITGSSCIIFVSTSVVSNVVFVCLYLFLVSPFEASGGLFFVIVTFPR